MKIRPTDTHNPEYGPDNPDTRPGPYYVTVVDAGRALALAGPFDTHPEALAQVAPARDLAVEYDLKAHFYAFGTARTEGAGKGFPPGCFNKQLGIPA